MVKITGYCVRINPVADDLTKYNEPLSMVPNSTAYVLCHCSLRRKKANTKPLAWTSWHSYSGGTTGQCCDKSMQFSRKSDTMKNSRAEF